MCLAIVSPRNTPIPSWEALHNAYVNNPDGGGFCYSFRGKVHVKKGFMTWKEYKEAIEEVASQVDLTRNSCMFHVRIKTHGSCDQTMCHPFPITQNEEELKATEYVTDYAVIHNGVISLTTSKATVSKVLSDTAVFIKDYLYLIAQNRSWFYNKANIKLIEELVGSSKVAILNGQGDVMMTSNFTEDNGIFYSNSSYKDGYFRRVGGYNYGGSSGAYSGYSGYGGYYGNGYSTASHSTVSSTPKTTSVKLMRCDPGDVIDSDSGEFLIEQKDKDTFFASKPDEFGISAIYQRYEDDLYGYYSSVEYSAYFADYEFIGCGTVYDGHSTNEKNWDKASHVTVYDDQFVGGLTPEVAIQEEKEEETPEPEISDKTTTETNTDEEIEEAAGKNIIVYEPEPVGAPV